MWGQKATLLKGNFDCQLIMPITLIVRITNYLHKYFEKYWAQLSKSNFTKLAHICKKKVTLSIDLMFFSNGKNLF